MLANLTNAILRREYIVISGIYPIQVCTYQNIYKKKVELIGLQYLQYGVFQASPRAKS